MSSPDVGFESVETPIDAIMLQGDEQSSDADVPAEFKGKSLTDVLNEVQKLQNTLRINEEVMRRMASQPAGPVSAPPPAQPQPTVAFPQQELTDEQIQEIAEKHGVAAAYRILQDRTNRELAVALERRLEPLAHSTMSTAEAEARRQWPLEFEIFEKEIQAEKAKYPGAQIWSNPESWRTMISLIRGDNVGRFVEAQQKKQGIRPIESIRAEEGSSAGFVPPTRPAESPGTVAGQLDALQRKVAAEFGFSSEAEYIRFSKLGDQIGG